MKHKEQIIDSTLTKEKISHSVAKLKSIYELYDNSKINNEQLKLSLLRENINWSNKTELFLKSPLSKEKNFKNFINTLDIYPKEKDNIYYPHFNYNNYKPIINENRIKEKNRVIWPKSTKENEKISEAIKDVLKRNTSVVDFKRVLSQNNITTKNGELNKVLHDVELGKELMYSDVMKKIMKFKDKPDSIESFVKKVEAIESANAIKPSTETSYSSKKKIIKSDTFTSKSEIYDWNANTINDAYNYNPNNYVDLNRSFSNVFFNKETSPKRKPIRKDNRKNQISKYEPEKRLTKVVQIFLCSNKHKYISEHISNLDLGTMRAKVVASATTKPTPSCKKRIEFSTIINSTRYDSTLGSSTNKKKNVKQLSLSEDNFFRKKE